VHSSLSPHPQPSSTEAQHDTTIRAGQKHPHPPPSPKEDSSDEELWAAMETIEDESTISKKRVKRSKGVAQCVELLMYPWSGLC